MAINPYTTTELSNDLARAGARMSQKTISGVKYLLLEKVRLVAGVPQVTTFVEMNFGMNADQKFTWASMGLPNLVKTNPDTVAVPIVIA